MSYETESSYQSKCLPQLSREHYRPKAMRLAFPSAHFQCCLLPTVCYSFYNSVRVGNVREELFERLEAYKRNILILKLLLVDHNIINTFYVILIKCITLSTVHGIGEIQKGKFGFLFFQHLTSFATTPQILTHTTLYFSTIIIVSIASYES